MSSESANESPARRRPPSVSTFLILTALAGYTAWVVFPMIWVAYSSFKADAAIFRDAFALPPVDDLRTENYARAWNEARFGDYFFNSVIVTGTP